ncbi:MAG TPA: GNAT family N-acetyltransferase [Trichormus sp. M33_DOE_039]|nr:GNAT family N-acetyltransferase [Trichormus sp. M33_DOE_039]
MVEIRPIKQREIEQVKQIIITVCLELWQGVLAEDDLKDYDSLSDIDNVQMHYFDNFGTFLVLVDGEQIVGTGAIRRLDNEICELKRMWFLKEYRGQGLGWQMLQMLFDFARQTGYIKVRLDIFDPERQSQALKLYKKLNFYTIERYNDSSCTVFMEKILSQGE